MTLDAVVFCDCFERGRLLSPPPVGCRLSVAESGLLMCGSDDLNTQIAFDRWRFDQACAHENGALVKHDIGNIALVAELRAALQSEPDSFPMLLSRVLCNGTHCCDFIPAHEVPRLLPEVEALAGIHGTDSRREHSLREFESQLRKLVEASLAVGKPIMF